jgi:hypothetical protein
MAHVDETRAIVEAGETYDGAVRPSEQADLGRPVGIREGATVKGSVYGETVEIGVGARIEGSVMASESVELMGGHVRGEIGCPGRVIAHDARVGGTITGKRVRLIDSIVRGNVVGIEAIVENSVALGLATADRSLTIEDSLVYSVRSHGETTFDGATIVLPQAIVNETPTFETPVTVAGLGELEVDAPDDRRLPTMTEDDLYDRDETTYLTLAPRVLNLEKVTDRLERLETAILDAVDDTSGTGAPETAVSTVLDSLGVDEARPEVVSD